MASLAASAGGRLAPVRTFLLLSSLSPQGLQTLAATPERLFEVNREIERFGGRVVRQWALLGAYDFLSVVEAEDHRMTGVKFADDRRATPEEKERLQTEGFGYFPKPREAWVTGANPDSRSKAQKLAAELDERRRGDEGMGR